MSPEFMAFLSIAAPVLLGWIVIMALTGWLASRKGRDGGLWVLAALFLGPIALLVVILAPRRPEKPGGPAALAPVPRLRLQGDSLLELDVAEGVAVIQGQLLPRVDGRPRFKLTKSALWHWSDGRPIADAEREELLAEVPTVGRHEGWNLTLDAEDAG
jgi:multidrug efflux pump subunit AcrA (membrane-fusion protein)